MLVNYTFLELPSLNPLFEFLGNQEDIKNVKQLALERLDQMAAAEVRGIFAKKIAFKVIKLDPAAEFTLDLGIVKSKGLTFTAVVTDLVAKLAYPPPVLENQVRPILDELRKLALTSPSFRRDLNLTSSNFEAILNQLLCMLRSTHMTNYERSAILKRQGQVREAMQNQAATCYRILSTFEHFVELFASCDQVHELDGQINYALFQAKPKTIWGQAFIMRWIDFSHNPPHTTLLPEEIGDFKRAYITHCHGNQEVRAFAYEVLKMIKYHKLINKVHIIIDHLCQMVMPLLDEKQHEIPKFASLLGFNHLQSFIDDTRVFFLSTSKLIKDNYHGLVRLDENLIARLKKEANEGIKFLPQFRCHYAMLYTFATAFLKHSKDLFDVFSSKPHALPKPGQPTVDIERVIVTYFELIEDDALIGDDGKKPQAKNTTPSEGQAAGAGEDADNKKGQAQAASPPAAMSAKQAAGAAAAHDEKEVTDTAGWTAVQSKPKKPPTMKYDQRVERWFTELKSHASWLAAPREVRVHAFSPLVDLFVNTNFSIEDRWESQSKLGQNDTRFRLVGDLIVPGKPDHAVVFRYTKGKDGLWYHRDMTFVVDEKMWRSAEFPELPARGKEQAKAVTVDWNNDSYTLDKETGTCLIDCGDHQIRLYMVKGQHAN